MLEPLPLGTAPANQLSTHVTPQVAAERALAPMVQAGLMSPEAQRQIAIASSNLAVMKEVSTPIGQRHFARTDALMQVRMPTPVSKAREVLSELSAATESMKADFGKYRIMFLEANARKAKLKVAMKAVSDITDQDQRDVALAEAQLEEARIQQMEGEVAEGAAKIQRMIATAEKGSQRYALVLKEAGKEEFTAADFIKEEVEVLHKSIWWHLATAASTETGGHHWDEHRTQAAPRERPRDRFTDLMKARAGMAVNVPEEVIALFAGMGISEDEVKQAFLNLEGQRFNFGLANQGLNTTFKHHFEAWLGRTVAQFASRVEAAVATDGIERLHRICKLVNPAADDAGVNIGINNQKRGSLLR